MSTVQRWYSNEFGNEVGLLSWLRHVGDTVLWYQLEGGWKFCAGFSFTIYLYKRTVYPLCVWHDWVEPCIIGSCGHSFMP